MHMTIYRVIVQVVRPVGAELRGPDLIDLDTGVYPLAGPDIGHAPELIYATAQTARVVGWHYHEWREGQPVSVMLYVEVDN